MIKSAKWGTRSFKADATACANEIEAIGDEVTPQQIVEFAKNENTELHKCFTWDNDEAARKYRVDEARIILRNLIIVRVAEHEKQEPVKIRLFYKTDSKEGYKPTKLILQNNDEYEKLLQRVRMELKAIQKNYKHLSDFDEVWEAIEQI